MQATHVWLPEPSLGPGPGDALPPSGPGSGDAVFISVSADASSGDSRRGRVVAFSPAPLVHTGKP